MMGHRVRLDLHTPVETISGELRKQSLEGVWIYSGWADKACLKFFPHHRIIQMVDQGEVPR